jgi:hypothetical protein
MATAMLQFTLPEEDEEFRCAQDGWKYRRIVQDLDNLCRTKVKYGSLLAVEESVWQGVRDWLTQTMQEEGLSWDL